MDHVYVPYGDSAADTAVTLLAAAEDLGLDAGVVGTTEGGFLVPKEVADKSKADWDSDNEPHTVDEAARANEVKALEDEAKPAKKAAKKSAKKSAAKKSSQ